MNFYFILFFIIYLLLLRLYLYFYREIRFIQISSVSIVYYLIFS